MQSEFKISSDVYAALSNLSREDRAKILDALMWHHFDDHYTSDLEGGNQAIFELIECLYNGGNNG